MVGVAGMETGLALAIGLVLGVAGFGLLAGRVPGASAAQWLTLFGAVVLVGAAAYYVVDAVGRPPARSALALAVNGGLVALTIVGLVRGADAFRTAVIAGLVLHGVWDLLHVASVLSPPRHGWLPAPCAASDWALAAALWAVARPDTSAAAVESA